MACTGFEKWEEGLRPPFRPPQHGGLSAAAEPPGIHFWDLNEVCNLPPAGIINGTLFDGSCPDPFNLPSLGNGDAFLGQLPFVTAAAPEPWTPSCDADPMLLGTADDNFFLDGGRVEPLPGPEPPAAPLPPFAPHAASHAQPLHMGQQVRPGQPVMPDGYAGALSLNAGVPRDYVDASAAHVNPPLPGLASQIVQPTLWEPQPASKPTVEQQRQQLLRRKEQALWDWNHVSAPIGLISQHQSHPQLPVAMYPAADTGFMNRISDPRPTLPDLASNLPAALVRDRAPPQQPLVRQHEVDLQHSASSARQTFAPPPCSKLDAAGVGIATSGRDVFDKWEKMESGRRPAAEPGMLHRLGPGSFVLSGSSAAAPARQQGSAAAVPCAPTEPHNVQPRQDSRPPARRLAAPDCAHMEEALPIQDGIRAAPDTYTKPISFSTGQSRIPQQYLHQGQQRLDMAGGGFNQPFMYEAHTMPNTWHGMTPAEVVASALANNNAAAPHSDVLRGIDHAFDGYMEDPLCISAPAQYNTFLQRPDVAYGFSYAPPRSSSTAVPGESGFRRQEGHQVLAPVRVRMAEGAGPGGMNCTPMGLGTASPFCGAAHFWEPNFLDTWSNAPLGMDSPLDAAMCADVMDADVEILHGNLDAMSSPRAAGQHPYQQQICDTVQSAGHPPSAPAAVSEHAQGGREVNDPSPFLAPGGSNGNSSAQAVQAPSDTASASCSACVTGMNPVHWDAAQAHAENSVAAKRFAHHSSMVSMLPMLASEGGWRPAIVAAHMRGRMDANADALPLQLQHGEGQEASSDAGPLGFQSSEQRCGGEDYASQGAALTQAHCEASGELKSEDLQAVGSNNQDGSVPPPGKSHVRGDPRAGCSGSAERTEGEVFNHAVAWVSNHLTSRPNKRTQGARGGDVTEQAGQPPRQPEPKGHPADAGASVADPGLMGSSGTGGDSNSGAIVVRSGRGKSGAGGRRGRRTAPKDSDPEATDEEEEDDDADDMAAGEWKGVRGRALSQAELRPYFNQPIRAAAKKLGLSLSCFKKVCRKLGVARWPSRKLTCLAKMRKTVESDPTYTEERRKELVSLMDKNHLDIMVNPDAPMNGEFTTIRQQQYKMRSNERRGGPGAGSGGGSVRGGNAFRRTSQRKGTCCDSDGESHVEDSEPEEDGDA